MAENPRQADLSQDEQLMKRIQKAREQQESSISELIGRRLRKLAGDIEDKEPPQPSLEDLVRESFRGPALSDLGFASNDQPLLGEPGSQVPVLNMLEALSVFRGPERRPNLLDTQGFDPFQRGRSVPFDFEQRV